MSRGIDEINSLDTVVVNNIIMGKIEEKLSVTDKIAPEFGIINEGVIKYLEYRKGITHYIYFKELGDNKVEIEDYLYEVKNKRLNFRFSGIVDFNPDKDGIANSLMLIKNLRFGFLFMKSKKDNKAEVLVKVQATYLAVFRYIHLIQTENEIKVLDAKQHESMGWNNKLKLSNKTKTITNDKKNIIHINEIMVITKNEASIITDRLKKHIQRKTEA